MINTHYRAQRAVKCIDFLVQLLESTNLLWPPIEASGRQLPLAEPPAQQVSVHLVQLTGERQEASAAVNLTDRREKTIEILFKKDFNTGHCSQERCKCETSHLPE